MVLAPHAAPLRIDATLRFDSAQQLYRLSFRALGTQCSIQFAASGNEAAASFAQEATQWIANFENKYSRFRDDSLISEINRQAGKNWVAIDQETESIFALCDDFHFSTQGILDPTMLPLIRLWDYRTLPRSLPDEDAIEAARQLVGWTKAQREPGKIFLPVEGMSLDLGGFGKEYAVDKVASLAVKHRLACCLVDLGRDLHAIGVPLGRPAWHVGLEDPQDSGKAWGSLALIRGGVATTGDYRRFFESMGQRYGHVLDPRSGRPVHNEVLAVTITANSCLEAGVLSTSAFILGQDKGVELIESSLGAEGCFVLTNGIHQTRNFHAELADN